MRKLSISEKITLLNQTALESLNAPSEQEIIRNFTEAGIKIFGADFGCAWLKVKANPGFKLAYKSKTMPYTPQAPRKSGLNARLQQSKSPYMVKDVVKAGLVKSDSRQYMRSLTGIPMIYKRNTYGNIILCFKDKKKFLTEDTSLCGALGHAAAQSITINRFYSQVQNFQKTLDRTLDSIFMFDNADFKITYANNGAGQQVGIAPKKLVGASITDYIESHERKKFLRLIRHLLRKKANSLIFETSLTNRKGRGIPVEMLVQYVKNPNRTPHFLAIVRDLSERKRSQAEIRRALLRDTLTGLPNRLLFSERLTESLEKSKNNKRKFAIIFIDLDQFKFINDTLGHVSGDALLRQAAQRLLRSVKSTDVVSRLGGDEFIILLNNISSKIDVEPVAERIASHFKDPFNLSGQEVFLNLSMGISIFPENGTDPNTLLKNADNALYRAKQRGGSSHEYYFPELKSPKFSNFELDRELRTAIKQMDFEFYFQPIYRLGPKKKIAEAEALLRWRHEKLGTMLPKDFMKHLEESGLISQLTFWQFEQVCNASRTFTDMGINLPIAINFSARQLLQHNIFTRIDEIMKKCGVDPKLIKLEITESLLIKNLETSMELLSQLRALGVEVVIDDFGTGYASLSYLKALPVDCLKIDQSFIQNMLFSKTDLAIVKTILGLGKDLGINVIAEGVESQGQHRKIKALGGRLAQGNWYGGPVRLKSLLNSLKKEYKTKIS